MSIYFMESEISEKGIVTRYLDLSQMETAEDWIQGEFWAEQVCSVPEAGFFSMAIEIANQAKLEPVKGYPESCSVYIGSQSTEENGHYFVRTLIIN